MVKPVVLCVDDEVLILDSLKIQIKKELGALSTVEAAESANETLGIVKELYQEGVEVVMVLCDWLMPGMKGDEFVVDSAYSDFQLNNRSEILTTKFIDRLVCHQLSNF